MTPYYSDDAVTIYHGDCFDILPSLERADLGFADPPYNYGFDYGNGFDDRQPADEYAEWCGGWFALLRERTDRTFITPGHGNLAQWIGRRPAGVAAWFKPGNPSGQGIFQFCEWEPIVVWGSGRIGGSDVYRATINPEFKGPVGHPCPKPLKLMTGILARSKPTTVLDPFMGSGTTLRAAKDLGIKAVGIEQNERYCELAANRMAQEVLAL